MDVGTFNTNGGDITFTVGEVLGQGAVGRVYSIDCNGDIPCEDLGPVVLKHYYGPYSVPEAELFEQKHLAKIGELKAVGSVDGYRYTLMTKWDGVHFDKLPTYERLSLNREENKDALKELFNSAISMIANDVNTYIRNNQIIHMSRDTGPRNVLLQEDNGSITSAKVIDWGWAEIIPAHLGRVRNNPVYCFPALWEICLLYML
ncbi:hypothetical protein CTA1_12912 [Colletotrichum tanaceti]|uniref:Protein kinase domain-containing protein n=1 Tax=Colletotrichum tanaceti TaxID=1306861 RepID=A0A4U6X5D5_9PEZI|nr:hypothetical protein CTA1_12912 [Colletotrichum tanaceti]